jgi:hypothetical protein
VLAARTQAVGERQRNGRLADARRPEQGVDRWPAHERSMSATRVFA